MTCHYAWEAGKQKIINLLHEYSNTEFAKHQKEKENTSSVTPIWWRMQGRIDQIHDLMSKISDLMEVKDK